MIAVCFATYHSGEHLPTEKRHRIASSKPLIVVAIGASAGSARVIKSILKNLKPTDQVAYVLVQHLDRTGKELIKSSLVASSPIPIKEIRKDLKLQSGVLYWVPPHTFATLTKNGFKTSRADSARDRLTVIDRLFASLASEFGSAAVGVLLSGEAGDGALGIKTINNEGGLTIVQDPDSAERASMPTCAIATGAVDHIVVPEKIPATIEQNIRFMTRFSGPDSREGLENQVSESLGTICKLLEKHTNYDFKHYKASTLVRRIQRRMHVLRVESVDAYIDRLGNSKEEAESLFKELLINVTSFFRDKASFRALESEVLQKLIDKAKEGQKIRIGWQVVQRVKRHTRLPCYSMSSH